MERKSIANKFLANALSLNKLSHAYIFIADEKKTLNDNIFRFIKSIFCSKNVDKQFYSCELCDNCKKISHNNYPDLYILDVEKSIKKEDILDLKYYVSKKANFNKRIYWIKNIDQFTPQAANALLKFLEEPEEDVIAILSCQNINLVLETIISRCQIVNLANEKENLVESNDYFKKDNLVSFFSNYNQNRKLAILNLLESIDHKEDVEEMLNIFLKNIKKNINDKMDVTNHLQLYSSLLSSIKDINANVNYNLILESFMFEIYINNWDISMLNDGESYDIRR